MLHLRAIFTVFFLFFTASLFAQQSLSLEKAIELALQNNLNLKKSSIDLEASGYSERRLWSELFPAINASASVGITSPFMSGDGFIIDEQTRRYSIGAGISLALNAGIPYSIKNIKLAHEANLLRYEDAQNQLSIQITKNYYALVAEKNNLELLREVQNLAQRQYERNQISFRNGLIGELALMQTRLAAENARFNLSTANIAYTNNMADFLSLLGMEMETDIDLTGDVKIIRVSANASSLIGQYLHLRPDIVRGRQEITRLVNAQKQAAMQGRAPSLNLSLDWGSSNFDPFTDSLSATARLSVPIDPWIPGTARSQAIGRASDAVEKAVLDLTVAENDAKTQIRSLSARLHNSWESILIARLSLEAAQRNYRLTEIGFNNGTIEYLALEDARNNMAGAAQRLTQSELSYFNMILDLSASLNINWNYLIETYGVQDE